MPVLNADQFYGEEKSFIIHRLINLQGGDIFNFCKILN